MSEQDDTTREALRDAWIESLLISATSPQDHDQRIARAMDCIHSESTAADPVTAGYRRKPRRFIRSGMMVVAVVLLLALFSVVQQGGSSPTAMAALERSLHTAGEPLTRKYLLQVEYRPALGGSLKTDNDLYVQGNNRFALRHPGLLPGTSFWLGQDGAEAWVVPAFGPVRTGDNTLLSRWLRSREQLDTPYLHVATVLTRMSRGYRLENLDSESVTIHDIGNIACQHVRATRTAPPQQQFPDQIELWTSQQTGMAVRLVAQWNRLEGEAGILSVILTYQGEETSIPDDWFTAQGHAKERRGRTQDDASNL